MVKKAIIGRCMLCKQPLLMCNTGFPTDEKRMPASNDYGGFTAKLMAKKAYACPPLNGYFPQGESQKSETKYPAKRSISKINALPHQYHKVPMRQYP